MSDSYLQQLVIDRCNSLGVGPAATFFGVSEGLVKQWQAGSKTPSLAAVEMVFQPSVPSVSGHEAQWDGKQVFLAMPCYKTADPRTLFSVLGIWDRQKFGASVRYGDAYIIHTRNNLMYDFLTTGIPEVLNVDDDMILPMGNAGWFNYNTGLNFTEEFAGMHTPTRLRSHGKTIVGGLYFGRNRRGRAIYYEAMITNDAGNREDALAHKAPRDDLRPVWWTGTGCLWFTRQVLLDIQATHPHLAPQHPTEPWHFFSNADNALHRVFSDVRAKVESAAESIAGGTGSAAEAVLRDVVKQMADAEVQNAKNSQLMQGEDQTFGKRAKVAGHQSYVDHGLVCGHAGGCIYGPANTGQR